MSVIQYVTWESTFYFVASLGFVNVILVLVFVRGNPAAAGYETSSLLGGPADSLETSERFSVPLLRAKSVPLSFRQRFFEKMAELWMNTKICLLNKYFWTLTLMNSLIPGAFYNFTGAWGGPYLRDVFSYSESQAAYILVLLNIAYIAGTPILSLISEAIHSRKYVICVTGVCASGLSIGFLLLPSTSTRVVVMLLIFSLGFFTTGATSTMITMFKELDSVEVSGTMIGWSNFFPFMATTILQIVGTVVLEAVDRDGNPGDPHSFRGFQLALWVPTVICCTLGTVGIFISKDTYPKADDYITLSGK
jgi:sugar phosphate permease